MKTYEVKGKMIHNNKKGVAKVDALSKQEVWNNPSDFGFLKIFSVNEPQRTKRFNKREINHEQAS